MQTFSGRCVSCSGMCHVDGRWYVLVIRLPPLDNLLPSSPKLRLRFTSENDEPPKWRHPLLSFFCLTPLCERSIRINLLDASRESERQRGQCGAGRMQASTDQESVFLHDGQFKKDDLHRSENRWNQLQSTVTNANLESAHSRRRRSRWTALLHMRCLD